MRKLRILCAVAILAAAPDFCMLAAAENKGIPLGFYIGTKDFEEYDAETIAEISDMSQSVLPGGKRRDYSDKICEVRKIKPDYKALVYRNVKEIYSYAKAEWQTASANNWLLKDINGQLVFAKQWPENYAVDIGNPGYQKWVADKLKEWLEGNGYFDGVFADNGLCAYVSEWQWDYTNKPINPRSGVYWTDTELKQAFISLHKQIKKAIGRKLLICNGIFDGKRFHGHSDDYKEVISNSPLDGIMSEGMWRAWRSEENWIQSLRLLSWIEDNFLKNNPDRYFIPVINKLPAAGIAREQLLLYGIASTLLGIRTSRNYIGGILERNDPFKSLPLIRKLRGADIGSPISTHYIIAGTRVFARDFSDGKVLVNPTSKTFCVPLERSYRTLDGNIVNEITLSGQSGEILLTKRH